MIRAQHLGLVVLALFFAGCLTFSSLDEPQAGQQGGSIELQTVCNGLTEPTLIRSSEESILAATTNLSAEFESIPECGLDEGLAGPDGFFLVQVEPGQRWHFDVVAADRSADVTLFALRTCDERTCEVGTNVCPAGLPERMNLTADEFGNRFIGVNTSRPSAVTMVANQVFCGDSVLQPGETCDDGNDSDDDKCGFNCRRIIQSGSSEFEPNDDVLEENYLKWDSSGTKTKVGGNLQGACDLDRYAVNVDEGTTLVARMLKVGSVPCEDENPPVALSFVDPLNPRTQTVMGTPTAEDAEEPNTCPQLLDETIMKDLRAGEFHFIVQSPPDLEGASQFTYLLEIEAI